MITLVAPSSGVRVGPNCFVEANTSIASSVGTGHMFATIQDPLLGTIYSSTQVFWDGLAGSNCAAVFGLINGAVSLGTAYSFGLADGASCTIRIQFTDSSGIVDSQSFPGFLWDAVTGLGALLGAIPSSIPPPPPPGPVQLHPDISTLTLSFIGSFTGTATVVAGSAQAIVYSVSLQPPGAGLTPGEHEKFQERVAQLAIYHNDSSAVSVADQTEDLYYDAGTVWLDESPANRVRVAVTAGFQVDLYSLG